MAITLYELVGRDDLRFSPYCWRTRFALAHKGLEFETVPVRFADKQPIAFSGEERHVRRLNKILALEAAMTGEGEAV